MKIVRIFPRGVFTAALVLGVLVVWQGRTRGLIQSAQDPNTQAAVAVEVAGLTSANARLRQELAQQTKQEYTLAQALVNRDQAEATLTARREQAAVLAGTTEVTGPGVIVTIKDELTTPQLVDVVNAVMNIGAEAVTVNGARLGPRYSIWGRNLTPPYIIVAVGSPAALSTALDRRGGVIDQIEYSTGALDLTIETRDQLTLPAAAASDIVYARPTE